MVTVTVCASVSPEMRTGGEGSALSNGITPPPVVLHAPNTASLLMVTEVVEVHVWVSV